METLFASDPLDAKRWTALVENSATPDVYYLPEYASATAEIEQSEPMALVAGRSPNRILAPLLVRHMWANADSSAIEWLDASTPYGYGGLLSLSTAGLADTPALQLFFKQLHDWCSSRRIVCCVIRLHPLLAQQEWFAMDEYGQGTLQLHPQRSTYSIDCNNWDYSLNRPQHMSQNRRTDLTHAQRVLRVTWASGEDRDAEAGLKIFSSLYNEMLEHRTAESFHRFPPSYFSSLAKLGSRMGTIIAWDGDIPVGAHIALAGNCHAHGHLRAATHLGRKYRAATLLYVEEARWARRLGCQLLHLGGGMQPGDGIETFKRSFHGPAHYYRYLTYIVDRDKFEMIRRLPDAPWPYNLPPSTNSPDHGTQA